jgi:transcriptional regulator with XRE-family HTH domain
LTKPSEFTAFHTDLGIAAELKDKEFRNQFFRTERELDIPAQLKALRKLRGLNQAELAEMIGTKQSGISRLERSSHGQWNLETLVKIAEALDARLAVLIKPYEAVMARYIAEERLSGKSAATADIETIRPSSSLLAEDEKKRNQNPPQKSAADADNRQGATWS